MDALRRNGDEIIFSQGAIRAGVHWDSSLNCFVTEDNTELILGFAGINQASGSIDTSVIQGILPSYNNWFTALIDEIVDEAFTSVLRFPTDGSWKNCMDWILANWYGM